MIFFLASATSWRVDRLRVTSACIPPVNAAYSWVCHLDCFSSVFRRVGGTAPKIRRVSFRLSDVFFIVWFVPGLWRTTRRGTGRRLSWSRVVLPPVRAALQRTSWRPRGSSGERRTGILRLVHRVTRRLTTRRFERPSFHVCRTGLQRTPPPPPNTRMKMTS